MTDRREIPETLLDLIYDAATDAHLWTSVLRRIAELTDSAGGILFGQSVKQSVVFFEHNGGLSEESSRVYKARHMRNPWSLHMMSRPVGAVVPSDEAMALPDLQRTAFFDEVLRPQGLGHNAMIALAAKRDFTAAFNMVRGPRQGPFGETELRLLAGLSPHLQRAMQLGFRIEAYRSLQRAEYQVLDRLSVGVILLNRDAKIIFANSAARAWDGAGGPLSLHHAKITHRSASQTRRLDELVQAALRGTPAAAIGIPRGHDLPPLTILASPVRGRDAGRHAEAGLKDAAVMVFIGDPADKQAIPLAWTMDAYGLTQAEARVAIAAATGEGLADIARRLALSPNTVKTHLHRIFGKTDTRGQAELVRFMAPLRLMAGGGPQDDPLPAAAAAEGKPDRSHPIG
jgi:DNA-binding CsgD family transcriptional regulator/PAS domain-containing protein